MVEVLAYVASMAVICLAVWCMVSPMIKADIDRVEMDHALRRASIAVRRAKLIAKTGHRPIGLTVVPYYTSNHD